MSKAAADTAWYDGRITGTGRLTREQRCDHEACQSAARWRAFLYVPAVRHPARPPGFPSPSVMPQVEVVVYPLPLFVCTGHKLTMEQAQRALTGQVRAKLVQLADGFDLRMDRLWVVHELIGTA